MCYLILHVLDIYRMLQIKLDQPVSDPASPREISNGDTAANLSTHIQTLRSEVARLRNQLAIAQQERKYNPKESLLM
jgi:coiled-coil domain-containing protein 6